MVFVCFLSSPLRVALQVLVASTPCITRIAATSVTREGFMWVRRHKGISPFLCPISKEPNNAFQHWLLVHFKISQPFHLAR